jgi:DNA-binding transcriptional MerR regulator
MNHPRGAPTYRTRDFAALAHVTVRTLRHYDRVGLLTPRRTPAGHRLYSARDLESLEEIAALKAIGLPLSTIASLRRRGPGELAEAIHAQRKTLEEQRRLLDKAIRAVTDFEQALLDGSAVDQALCRIIKAITMQDDNTDNWRTVYESLMEVWLARRASMSPELLIEIGREWEVLTADVHQALGENPRGPTAQRLATRMLRLLARLYGDGIPHAKWVIAARNIEKWSPSFGAWPGWSFLSEALAVNTEAV